MEKLDINSILDVNEIDLFDNTEPEEIKDSDTTEVTSEDLFTEEPESVGSEDAEDIKDEEPSSTKNEGSPKTNFYSSITKALKEEGVFLNLEETDIDGVKSPEDFVEIIEKQVQSKLDERQRRIDEALNVGVEPDEIKVFENTLNYLEGITEELIKDETDKGDSLRKQLIYQDFINRGYSKERAQREVTKSFNAGTDIDDAKEALNSNKEYFKEEYEATINESKIELQKIKEEQAKQAESLKKSILEDNKVFGDISIDKATRQKVLDNISKPVYKDPKSGEVLTALQKYERDNKLDFVKNIGLLYTLTDGFKNIDKVVKSKVNKEMKKGMSHLESVINNTSRTSDGNLNFVSGVNDEESSFKGWALDIK